MSRHVFLFLFALYRSVQTRLLELHVEQRGRLSGVHLQPVGHVPEPGLQRRHGRVHVQALRHWPRL